MFAVASNSGQHEDCTKSRQHAAPATMGTPAAVAELSPRGAGACADSEERGEDEQRKEVAIDKWGQGQNGFFLAQLTPF